MTQHDRFARYMSLCVWGDHFSFIHANIWNSYLQKKPSILWMKMHIICSMYRHVICICIQSMKVFQSTQANYERDLWMNRWKFDKEIRGMSKTQDIICIKHWKKMHMLLWVVNPLSRVKLNSISEKKSNQQNTKNLNWTKLIKNFYLSDKMRIQGTFIWPININFLVNRFFSPECVSKLRSFTEVSSARFAHFLNQIKGNTFYTTDFTHTSYMYAAIFFLGKYNDDLRTGIWNNSLSESKFWRSIV